MTSVFFWLFSCRVICLGFAGVANLRSWTNCFWKFFLLVQLLYSLLLLSPCWGVVVCTWVFGDCFLLLRGRFLAIVFVLFWYNRFLLSSVPIVLGTFI